jgi:hypothetical protein
MRVAISCILAFSLSSCGLFKPAPTAPFELVVHVESDPGRSLQGVVVSKRGDDAQSTTDGDGDVTLHLSGLEGQSVDLTVKCPTDYVTSPKPLTVMLRRGSKTPEYDWSCPPAIRHLVVALRTDNGPSLPVSYLGQTIGRTSATGTFTHVFALQPGTRVDLELDTTKHTKLHPANPKFSATVGALDDVVTFEQTFNADPPLARSGLRKSGPVDVWGKKNVSQLVLH